MCFANCTTLILICLLSFATIYISIFHQYAKEYNSTAWYYYGIFLAIYTLGTCHSIQRLFVCARTDPGFIPSPNMLSDTILTHKSLKRISDPKQKHYVKYSDRDVVDDRLQVGLDYTDLQIDPNKPK